MIKRDKSNEPVSNLLPEIRYMDNPNISASNFYQKWYIWIFQTNQFPFSPQIINMKKMNAPVPRSLKMAYLEKSEKSNEPVPNLLPEIENMNK